MVEWVLNYTLTCRENEVKLDNEHWYKNTGK